MPTNLFTPFHWFSKSRLLIVRKYGSWGLFESRINLKYDYFAGTPSILRSDWRNNGINWTNLACVSSIILSNRFRLGTSQVYLRMHSRSSPWCSVTLTRTRLEDSIIMSSSLVLELLVMIYQCLRMVNLSPNLRQFLTLWISIEMELCPYR